VEASAPALLADQFQSMGGSRQSLGSISARAVVNRQVPDRLLNKLDQPVHRGPQELRQCWPPIERIPYFSRMRRLRSRMRARVSAAACSSISFTQSYGVGAVEAINEFV
jgi:hypothetical protein